MRTELHHVAILDRPRLALVRVHDDVARARLAENGLPFDPCRETRAAVARDPGGFQRGDDRVRCGELAQELEPSAGGIVLERLVPLSEPDRGAVVRRVRHGGDDLVAAGVDRRQIAVPEARDLDRVGVLREHVARAVAVADRSGAHSHGVDRHLEELVEGDHLVHLAAPDVHVVGEGVGEVRRQRPDLPPHAPEVVEKASPFGRKLGQKHGQLDHVHRGDPTPERTRPPAGTRAAKPWINRRTFLTLPVPGTVTC